MKKLLVALSLAALTSPLAGNAYATEDLMCAAVLPCNEDGSVQAPFDKGECAPLYEVQCAKAAASDCESKQEILSSDNRSLKREIKKLRREVRRLKRARS